MAWTIDTSHSEVSFSARHMMISKVRGRFNAFSGTIEGDEASPVDAKIDVAIDAASLTTGDEKRDGHLKSADFLDVATYPSITFVSTSVEHTDATNAKLHGDLTIKGVTKPVTLAVAYQGQSKSPWGATNAGFSATTTFNRKDWGLEWNAPLETGGVLVGEEIAVAIELELIQS